jgi:transcriptional regulator with XRE-family HTH domain
LKPEELGQRIRQAREARGLTQEQLAERIARDQRSVSEYESGKRRIYAHDLPNIARALNVPVMYFFDDALTEADLDATLLEEYHRLDEAGRKLVLEMIRLFVRHLSS